jgi:single-strand DNA-binding protein
MNLNKAQLIGRVTKDPDVKTTPNGTEVTTFGLATNYSYRDADGTKQEKVSFHNCVSFGKIAKTIGEYVKKGQEIYVEGRIEYRQWESKEGVKKNATQITIETFQFGQKSQKTNPAPTNEPAPAQEVIDEEIKISDIPF